MSVCICVCVSVCLSVLQRVCLSICLCYSVPGCLSVPAYVGVCLSICLSVSDVSVCVCVCLYVCLSVCLCLSNAGIQTIWSHKCAIAVFYCISILGLINSVFCFGFTVLLLLLLFHAAVTFSVEIVEGKKT